MRHADHSRLIFEVFAVSLIISLLRYDARLTGYVNLHFRGAYSLLQEG